MSDDRLAAGVEVSAFLRQAEAAGGFGMVLAKGDESRGAILLAVAERGRHVGFYERTLQADGNYRWAEVGPSGDDSQKVTQYVARRRKSDPDCWLVELDVPVSERFIAETIRRT